MTKDWFAEEVAAPYLVFDTVSNLPPGETFRPFDVSDGHLGFDE